eukprot:2133651-Pleurochrysis_carterae.AAC.1
MQRHAVSMRSKERHAVAHHVRLRFGDELLHGFRRAQHVALLFEVLRAKEKNGRGGGGSKAKRRKRREAKMRDNGSTAKGD